MTMAKIPKTRAVIAEELGTGNSVEVTAVATAFHAATEGMPNLRRPVSRISQHRESRSKVRDQAVQT